MHDSIFLCYRFLRVTRHPRYSGQDLLQLMHLSCGRHHIEQDSDRLHVQTTNIGSYNLYPRINHHLYSGGEHPPNCGDWGEQLQQYVVPAEEVWSVFRTGNLAV
jgi:hypothetical protein